MVRRKRGLSTLRPDPTGGLERRATLEEFLRSDLFAWAILPGLIFLARVVDVSMGTVRVILISKGIRALASGIGFLEVRGFFEYVD